MSKTKARTLQTREQTRRKRAARKAREKEVEKPTVPDLFGELTNGGQPREHVVKSKDVQQWFREGYEKLYGGKVTLPPNEWKVAERKMALTLIEMYGADLVKKTVAYFCEHWEAIVERSNGRLFGKPTINLLMSMRASIFTDAELGKKPRVGKRRKSKRHAGEWKDGKPDIGLGW